MQTNTIEKKCEADPKLDVLYAGECVCDIPCNKVVNLLVMGQTGAGKTTFIDSFINYMLGIEFYDNFRYKLVDERELIDQRTSSIDRAVSDQEKA